MDFYNTRQAAGLTEHLSKMALIEWSARKQHLLLKKTTHNVAALA